MIVHVLISALFYTIPQSKSLDDGTHISPITPHGQSIYLDDSTDISPITQHGQSISLDDSTHISPISNMDRQYL